MVSLLSILIKLSKKNMGNNFILGFFEHHLVSVTFSLFLSVLFFISNQIVMCTFDVF